MEGRQGEIAMGAEDTATDRKQRNFRLGKRAVQRGVQTSQAEAGPFAAMAPVMLLGCGGVGRRVAELLADPECFAALLPDGGKPDAGLSGGAHLPPPLLLADLRPEATADTAAQLRQLHPRPDSVSQAQLDTRQPKALRAELAKCSLVVNCAGPFTSTATVLQAALDEGIHYIDICDDPEPTLAMMALHQRAQKAGVTALVGMGASPGVTNLLANRAAAALRERWDSQVVRLDSIWDATGADQDAGQTGSHTAALQHWIEQLQGYVPAWLDGGLRYLRPLRRHRLQLPGLGRHALYSVGHPEPVTLPRRHPGLRESRCLMRLRPSGVWLLRRLTRMVDEGACDIPEAARLLAEELRRQGDPSLSALLLMQLGALGGMALRQWTSAGGVPFPPLLALAEDDAGRRACAWTPYLPGRDMATVTAAPAAAAVLRLLQGQWSAGVLAPEDLDRGEEMLQALERLALVLGTAGGGPMVQVELG